MKKILLILTTCILIIPSISNAWTATSLGGGNWAIGCANGQNYSYSGSSAGLDTVGPALCPGGITETLSEIKANMIQTKASFPPNGYPCLGCDPCPEPDQENFCSNTVSNTGSAVAFRGVVVFNTGGYVGKERVLLSENY